MPILRRPGASARDRSGTAIALLTVPALGRGRRRPLRVLDLLVVAVLAGVGCGDSADVPRATTAAPDLEMQECERHGYPCTWAEVDIAVGHRLDQIFGQVVDLMYDHSPTALWQWLQTVPDLAAAGVEGDSAAIWFRLEGSRRVYVMAPHPAPGGIRRGGEATGLPATLKEPPDGPLEAGVGGALSRLLRGSMNLAVPDGAGAVRHPVRGPVDVTGRDRNQDAQVDQRDERRALVMVPMYFERCYDAIEDRFEDEAVKQRHRGAITAICEGRASPTSLGLTSEELFTHGDRVAALLEEIPAYRGNVDVLEDQEADHEVVRAWNTYDVVHLTTHGSETIWAFGRLAPMPEGKDWFRPTERGLHMAWSRAGRFGPERAVYGVDLSWVRGALPDGLDRTLVFAAACESQGLTNEEAPELVGFLAGSTSGVLGWNILVPWDDNQFLAERVYDLLGRGWTVRQSLDSLRARRAEFLRGTEELQSYLLATDLEYHGSDLRVFEIVTLLDPATMGPETPGPPLRDGFRLNALLVGALSDGLSDELTVAAEVVGVTEALAPETFVHLELDGVRIGQPQPLTPESRVGPNRYRLHFLKTPVGRDLEVDTEYQIEAVVRLPEGGESRYAVRLVGEVCVVPSQGEYEGELTGDRARTVERGSRGAFAKILSSPLGGWALQLESRERGGRDLSMVVLFDVLPREGTSVTIHDPTFQHLGISGTIDRFDSDLRANWAMGNMEIVFTTIVEQPGKPFAWVCGEVRGDLTGFRDPPPGSMEPVRVAGAFEGRFRAEWFRNR